MKRREQAGAVLLALSLVLGGCGEQAITMTPEEEDAIVTYASHVVSKFNTRQPDGLSYVPDSVYQDKTQDETGAPGETETPDETESSGGTQQESEGHSSNENTEAEQAGTLSEALGLDGISAECTAKELQSSYVEPDFYALDATEGNVFLIVHINLKNQTNQEITCDMLSLKPRFEALVNGKVKSAAKTTILLNDLGTYQGTIAAGETVETLLFFEVPADIITAVDSLSLTVESNGTSREAAL